MRSSLFLVAVLVCGLVGAQPGGLPERVEKLESDYGVLVKSRVAFSAALVDANEWTTQGPFEADKTLEFKRVITNVGDGYDPQTGFFTAPAKGLYYIQVTGVAGPTGQLNAGLKKNGDNIFAIYQKAGTQAAASNGVVLALEAGDRLCVQLWAGQTIADQGRLSTFTGFLVFPM
ncbi:complement C1q-like protein 2 [Fundulus heteroclitus]|uniref:complement C1q-like protein 2 n=1 Tax=Fundulus heteroclitus TaxID=8078 RepID=UPI00165A5F26|nr:complement C1q-like protein 2 [Fundulus heteroclitus]